MVPPLGSIATFVLLKNKYWRVVPNIGVVGILIPIMTAFLGRSVVSPAFLWSLVVGVLIVGSAVILFFKLRTILTLSLDASGNLAGEIMGVEAQILEAPLTFEIEYEKVPRGTIAGAFIINIAITFFSRENVQILRIWGRSSSSKYLQLRWRKVPDVRRDADTYMTWSGHAQFGNLNQFAIKSNRTVLEPVVES